MMIPETITLVPNFLMLTGLHWIDTYLALTIPLFNYPYGIFLVRQYLLTLPDSLEDAARIDGANDFAIYAKIFLPLSKPVLTVIGVLSFTGVWTSFFWELIVTRSMRMRTVSVGIAMFASEHMTYVPDQMVIATVASLPVLLIFFLGQKYFMTGISIAGTIK
jgi:multiple sugar transport system permease protein